MPSQARTLACFPNSFWAPAALCPHISPTVKGTSLPLCIGRRSKKPGPQTVLPDRGPRSMLLLPSVVSCSGLSIAPLMVLCFLASLYPLIFSPSPCSCHGPLICFGEVGCNSGWLWEGPALFFPLGEAQHETPSVLRHLHSLPNPCRFPAFLTLSQPSRRDPGPPLSLLPVLLKGWSEQWPGDRPIVVFFCCGGCCCGKIWTARTMGEMRHEN